MRAGRHLGVHGRRCGLRLVVDGHGGSRGIGVDVDFARERLDLRVALADLVALYRHLHGHVGEELFVPVHRGGKVAQRVLAKAHVALGLRRRLDVVGGLEIALGTGVVAGLELLLSRPVVLLGRREVRPGRRRRRRLRPGTRHRSEHERACKTARQDLTLQFHRSSFQGPASCARKHRRQDT
jgi:hypothetical protein